MNLALVTSRKDDNNMDIYISNKEDNIEDELIAYLKEKQANKKVSKITLQFLRIIYYYLYTFFL
jgi:hypothetical protein